jgi:endoglucanase
MKKPVVFVLTVLFIVIQLTSNSQNAFNKGVNLTGWFSAGSARSIPFYKYSKKDLENIKSLGCDVIRLPINLHFMTSGTPDYKVDTLLFQRLDQVIAWTDELGLKLILDNHTIDGANAKTVETPLVKIWPQMARHFKNAPKSVIYEILNEPNTFAATDWFRIQKMVLDSIRSIDTLHTVIVTGADWGGIPGLTKMTPLADKKLIYSFHFYDPFLFTHQAATWASPSLGDLGGVPFPYNATKMPACPASLKGTWVENSLNSSYKTDGTVAKLKSTIDQAINWGKKYNVPVFCGEMGVFMAKSPDADRAHWYKEVVGYLSSKGIPWTMWDYQGGFGLFNKGSNETFEYDINRTMAEGMGFTLPPYKEFIMKPDTASFDIYTDFMGEGLQYGGVPGGGIADLAAPNAYSGNNCVYLTGTPQYGAIDFDFTFNKDLSMLKNANSFISLWVKGSAKDASVTLRFLDTKTADPTDHPWRMDYTLTSTTKAPFDGKWYNVTIPLKSFQDVGSWDGAWFNTQNKFDWKAVDKFQIVAERAALTGKEFWFDEIKLVRGTGLLVSNHEIGLPSEVAVFPNPASIKTAISFYAPAAGKLEISVHDLSGRLMKTIYTGTCTSGRQQFEWDLNDNSALVQSGIYLCKVQFNGRQITRKISVIR